MGSHKINDFVLYAPTFLSFCKYCPLRPKIVVNNSITITYHTVVSDGVHVKFVLLKFIIVIWNGRNLYISQ